MGSTVTTAVVLLLGPFVAGCAGGEEAAPPGSGAVTPVGEPRPPSPVALDAGTDAGSGSPAVRLGVLLAVSTPSGQGQDVGDAAQGAEVAAYRLGLGGVDVQLDVQVDDGTVAGARQAVAALVGDGVSGIVVASRGDHLLAALGEASAAGVATLLPYDRPSGPLPQGVWVTGPDRTATDDRLRDALAAQRVERPFVVSAAGVDAPDVDPAGSIDYLGANPDRLVTRLRAAAGAGKIDGVVLAAPAAVQADLVARLQGAAPGLRLVLTPEALSPVFAPALVDADGTLAGDLTTVGTDAADTTTLAASEAGERTASYFAALRLAAGDEVARDLLGDRALGDVAAAADTASHDAVVALAAAVAAAGDTDPAAVRAALGSLVVDGSDGVAGPDLDFTRGPSGPALAATDVVVLHATTQDPGVRPVAPVVDDAAALRWFAVPASGPAGAG